MYVYEFSLVWNAQLTWQTGSMVGLDFFIFNFFFNSCLCWDTPTRLDLSAGCTLLMLAFSAPSVCTVLFCFYFNFTHRRWIELQMDHLWGRRCQCRLHSRVCVSELLTRLLTVCTGDSDTRVVQLKVMWPKNPCWQIICKKKKKKVAWEESEIWFFCRAPQLQPRLQAFAATVTVRTRTSSS